jgi:hypothetical protein
MYLTPLVATGSGARLVEKGLRMDEKTQDGVLDAPVKGWDGFLAFINDHSLTAGGNARRSTWRAEPDEYVWRGEPETEKTPLVSSFDREHRASDRGDRAASLKRHRRAFLYAARGRTEEFGLSIAQLKHHVRAKTLNENHLWAFGQHYGLVTPLLDWTISPFVAAFFACEGKQEGAQIVYGLKYRDLRKRSEQEWKYDNPYRPVEYFSPMSSEFGRLTSQQGLFIFTEDGRSVVQWVKQLFAGEEQNPILVRIKIPAQVRKAFLSNLNLMGINHRSIYPDVYGAAKFCNMGLEIGPGYADALVPKE